MFSGGAAQQRGAGKGRSGEGGNRRRPRPRRVGGLAIAAGISLALVTSVVAVIAVTSEREEPYVPLAATGKAIDTEVDPIDAMDRPRGGKGVALDGPDAPTTEPEGPLGTKPGKSCDEPEGEAPARGELAGVGDRVDADEICVADPTGQSADLLDAPLFSTADGFRPAPDPKPAPQPDDETTTPSEDASDGPTDEPSGDPSSDPSSAPSDAATGSSDDPADDGTGGAPGDGSAAAPSAQPSSAAHRSDVAASSGSVRARTVSARGSPRGDRVLTDVAPPASTVSRARTAPVLHAPPAAPPAGEYLAPNWVQATPASKPSNRDGAAMAYDPVRQQTVLFGGRGAGGVLNAETWVWNGSSWTRVYPTVSPSARRRAAIAWDPVRGVLVMFGGQSSGTTALNDVWTWNGTTWAQDAPTGTLPTARTGAAMAYDPNRAAMILFGGQTASGGRNDTWQLKSNAWTQVQATGVSGAPTARYDHRLAYSQSTSQMVLFGGSGGTCPNCGTLSDTWILPATATSWSSQSPAHVPPKRGEHMMTYDPGLGAVVVTGGLDTDGTNITLRNDTWAWTGNDWSRAVGNASPSGRASGAMAPAPNGQVVLFGGTTDAVAFLGDTWTYSTAVPVIGIGIDNASDDEWSQGDPVWVGESIKVTLTAVNAGVNDIASADHVSIVSALQDTLLAAGTGFAWGASGSLSGLDLCQTGGSLVCGIVQDLTATIGNVAIPAGQTRVGEFLATVAGTQKGCELVDVPAVASSLLGSSGPVSSRITVCGGGLGLEDWWTFDSTDLGGGGSASVNVANGNLVVKQYDTDPVQMPGRLAMGLGRIYNSQDHMTAGGPIGAGWQFDIGDTGEFAGGFGLFGLSLPNLQTVLQPLSMPYVDRDGTRHVFKLRSVAATVGGTSLPVDLNSPDAGPILDLLNPATLPFTLTSTVEGLVYGKLCIDQAYAGPPGSNMFLFRYIGTGASGCASATEENKLLSIGWSLVRPDRVRYDFDLLGNLLRVTDPAGEQLIYTPGVQYGPTQIRSSSCTSGAACPKTTIDYDAGGAGDNRHVKVTDTAGRVTSYVVSRDLTLPLLLQVWEPGNPLSATAGASPTASYTYATAGNPCPGSVNGTITSGQLCSVTDANGERTTFSYVEAPLGPDRIDLVKDRRTNAPGGSANGLATKYTWSDPATSPNGGIFSTTADMAALDTLASCGADCHRVRYSAIDTWGRVGQIAQGTTAGSHANDPGSGTYYAQAGYFWDGMGASGGIASCSQPTLTMNHNLCQVIRRAVPSNLAFTPGSVSTATVSGTTAHDQAVDYLYGDFGQRLRQRVLLDATQQWTDANSSVTTWGSHEQYFDANKNQRFFNNHVRGNGVVKATAAGGTYRQSVLQDAPLSYWRLDETAGTTMSSVTGTNNGGYGAGVTLGEPGIVSGNPALGESTTGWGSAVSPLTGFAQGTSAADSDFTVETWMKAAGTGAEYSFQWGGAAAYASTGRLNGGLPFVALYSNAASAQGAVVYSTTSVADNEWHHVVFRYTGVGDASGIQIWIDGQQAPTAVYSNTLSGPFASTSALALSALSAGASSLDELAIYTSALPPARIQAHYTAARGATRIKPETLYAVVDEIQELSPRGNAPGNTGTWGEYLTSFRRDIPADGELASTNKTAGATVCGTAPRGNTGLLCEVDTPAAKNVSLGSCRRPTGNLPAGSTVAPTPSASYASSCTTYEYNGRGQRTLMRTPKANAASSTSAYEYRYYPIVQSCTGENRSSCDLSGSVSAGGWLKAVVDPAGEKVVYAYDAAGNVARTWDRNASHGKDLAAAWADANAPPSVRYTDTVSSTPVTSDSLSVSNTALIAVGPDGTVTGAGGNASGELGDGSTTARANPVRADPIANAVQVAQSATGAFSGCAFTVFLTGSGQVWATGAGVSTPYKVSGLPTNIISVVAGGCHALALDAEGGLWGWGANNVGQVGNGTTAAVPAPVKVLDNVSTMAAGYVHSMAVTTDGKTWAWGSNNTGQLGLGTTTNRSTPGEVTALKDAGIRQLSGGFASSYAVGRDGTVWSWGYNAYGELADGTTTQRTTPVKVTTLGPGTTAGPVRQVVGSAYGAASLMADGTVRVWGLNNTGQSGGGSSAGAMPAPTTVPDLTGQVAIAGGWATYATADQGGRIRVWGATSNNQLANGSNPTTTGTPTLAGIDISPYRTALWGTQGTRDATGNLTTVTRDRLGQARRTRTGRGHDITSSAYDRMVGYDAAGRPLWSAGAQHRSPGSTARTTYDPFGNPVKTVDARGVASRATYDALNRQVTSQVTRGVAADAPASCSGTATAAQWTAGQDGHRICTSQATYDGVGRQITLTDADGQVTTAHFDAADRKVRLDSPRNHDGVTTLSARWNYDREGRVLDACSPRQFAANEPGHTADSAAGCTSSGVYSRHLDYDAAGNVRSETRYRAGSGQPEPLVTAYGYDADRNTVSVTDANGHETTATYDLLDRREKQTVPRTASRSFTTRWDYDPSGNITAVRAPGSINTGSGADGHLVVDGSVAANSSDGIAHGAGNPFQVPDGAQYRNVTLQNGAHITSAVPNGLVLHATGTVTVCSTCVVTMTGKGSLGGPAGTGANNGNGSDAANPNPGNGGKGGSGGLLGLDPSGGGGGGHKTDGGNAGTAGSGPGLPGKASGTSDFATVGTDYLRGSGGGGGGGGKNLLGVAGAGGNGGGFVRITANRIVVNGSVDASGADGGVGSGSSGGGGGGAGGGIWLAAPDVDLAAATSLDVTGGTGGAGAGNREGGNGAAGYIRIDADAVTNEPAGADRTRAAMITSVSYDAANRPLDTIEGAQTLQADPTVDAGEFAVPDPNGMANTRTRAVYDADGRVVATLPPQAFSNAASLTAPNNSTVRRVDYDLDGLASASYAPRYDNSSGSTTTSVGSGNDGGGTVDQQAAQCTTGRVVDQAAGATNKAATNQNGYPSNYSVLPLTYGSQVGVCVTRTSYDAVGNVKRSWLPTSDGGASGTDNGYLEYSYTGDRLTATITAPDPNSGGRVTAARMRYDGVGREIWNQDANDNLTQTAYTGDGLVRRTVQQAYDPDDNTATGGTNGPLPTVNEVVDFSYDANGNQTKRDNADSSQPLDVTSQTWTSDDLVAQITAPGPDTTAGRTTAVTRYGYDAVGNVTQTWMPEAVENGKRPVRNEFTFDNLLSATHTPITDSSYRSVRYAYSPAGMKVATETARCTSASYADCTPGNTAFLTAGVVKLTYGANGRTASQVGRDRDPLEGPTTSITTTYAQNGGPAKVIDPTSGITTDVGYYLDGMTRRVSESGAGLSGTGSTNTYAYDAAGAVTVRTDKTGASGATADATITSSYRYNHAGLATSMYSDVLDVATSYTWDDAGRILTAQTGAHLAEWTWYPNDGVARSKTVASGTTIAEFRYEYDTNRNITKQTVTGTDGNYTNEYSYTPGQQVKGWTYTPAGGTQQTTTYGWDKNSNRTRVDVNVGGTSNVVTTGYNQDNSITSVDAPGTANDRTYTYNRAGLLTDDGCSTYTYDAFDRTEKQVTSGSASCGNDSRTTRYTYDGLDRQRSMQVTGSSKAGANRTTRSIYDGLGTEMVGQTEAVNGDRSGPTVLYQLDSGGTAVGYEQTGAGAGKAFLDHDGNGNVTSVVSTGHSLVCGARYDPFGTPVEAATGTETNGVCHNSGAASRATGNAAWYRGQVRDGSTGNYQLGTRTYNPGTGTFTTPDSYRVSNSATDLGVGTDPLTMNTYSYVNGNPVNLLDSDGHAPMCVREGTCKYDVTSAGAVPRASTAQEKYADAVSKRDATKKAIKDAEAMQAKEFDVKAVLIDVAKELSGIADIERCIFDKDIGACAMTILSVVGFGFGMAAKIKKLTKGVGKAIDAYKSFRKAQDLAKASLSKLRGGLDELNSSLKGLKKAADAEKKAARAKPAKVGGGGSKTTRKGRDNGTCSLARSFGASTLVLMADGTRKPIKDVQIGDLVLATDPVTGEQVAKRVTHLWVHHDDLTELVLNVDADGDGVPDRLVTTEDHPFWNATDQAWEGPEEFTAGDEVIDEQWNRIEVAGLDPGTTRRDLAYNLTVEGIHTYHVGAADVLVHNTGHDCGRTLYHGTDVESALDILNNGLDSARSGARHIDGPGGFHAATKYTDAEFFALRREPGAVLKIEFTDDAFEALQAAGARLGPIPLGPKSPRFSGDEMHIPDSAFELFNDLRRQGGIRVSP